MDDPEIGRREHHRDLIDSGQRREHFGVAWIEIAPGMQGLFVQGSRADRVDPTGHGEFRGCLDVAECGCARDRGQFAPRQIGGDEAEIDTIDDTIFEHRRLNFGRRHDSYGERTPHDASCGPQPLRLADHQRAAARADFGVAETLHNDFGADAGGIAHGDGDQRTVGHTGTFR